MSEIKVNKLSPRSGTAVTLGDSGDTFTIPSGVTLAIQGSVSGFTSAGIDDNATSVAITISSAEDVTFTEDILLGDSKKALFGAGSDLQIYHDGNNSIITEEGGGNFQLRTNGPTINLQKGNSEDMAVFTADGSVSLYYDNAKKFETTSAGATVTGNIIATGTVTMGGGTTSGDIIFGDDDKAIFGASSDLKIYHNGSSIISEEGGGTLQLRTNGPSINLQKENSEDMAVFTADGSVSLWYDNAKKFETTSTGATVTGVASASGAFLSTVNNSLLTFGGGNAGNVGSNLTMYGGANGSAGDFRFRNATTINAFITGGGQIQGVGGAVSAPTFSFTNDSNTGMSRPTTDAINFVTAGAERARIDASGNLLVGTTSSSSVTAGIKLLASNAIASVISGGTSGYFGRLSNDGDVIKIRKDSATVGVIGTQNWGIGTSNPITPIHINSNTPIITFEETDQSNRRFQIGSFGNAYAIYDATNTQFRYVLDNSGNHIFNEGSQDSDFRVESNGNAHMLFVDGGNDNVGIGTGSPDTNANLTVSSDNTKSWIFFERSGSGRNDTAIGNSGGNMVIKTGGDGWSNLSERMRIDSSGNVYIGKTSGILANVGHEFNAGSYASHTRDGDVTLYLNRKSSNGTIQEFRKDNTKFGSISCDASQNLTIQGKASSDFSILFGTNKLNPKNYAGTAAKDNAVDLGDNDDRWKDIYLGGGAFLGGTGTANKLDDYEEGAWTPNLDGINSSNASGQYTKIGNVCTAKFKISSDGSGSNINITGFPFTSQAGCEQQGLSRETQTSGKLFFIRMPASAVAATIIRYDASSSITSNDTFEGQITYITNT
jgi:hypothetical protein